MVVIWTRCGADEATAVGPVVSEAQFDKIQALLAKGLEEGATLVSGGLGRAPPAVKGDRAHRARQDAALAKGF